MDKKQLGAWEKSIENHEAFDRLDAQLLIDEIRRLRRMVDELLKPDPAHHYYGQCHWCDEPLDRHNDCVYQRIEQARDWEPEVSGG